ncbi:MAG: Omp28-related outer membrane protein [bacterium]
MYFYNFLGYPSLFLDGRDIWTGSSPSDWDDSIAVEITKPSVITLNMTGTYNSSSKTGVINASFRNDSTATITARVYFVITEDSLYHLDPNGHAWHNHLARDFLPDQTGEQVTITPNQTVVKSRNFTLDATWVDTRCYIVAWLQADAPSRRVFQAGEIKMTDLTGIEDITPVEIDHKSVRLLSNPNTDHVKFAIHLCNKEPYQISIYDIQGRLVKVLKGWVMQENETVVWDRKTDNGKKLNAGIYFYLFRSSSYYTEGKIIIQ